MAKYLTRRCLDDHYHLPIEGSSPGLGNRAEAAGIYQVGLCYAFCQAIDHTVTTDYAEYAYAGDEEPSSMEVGEPAGDEAGDPEDVVRPPRGVLKRLTDTDNQQAKRTVQRLHRNLGHPTNGELVRLLQTKNAAEPLLQAARELECNLCDLHRRPAGVPVSSFPRQGTFNTRVQADTLWIQVPGARRQLPILMISDSTTRLMAGRYLQGGERSEEFIKQLERAWIRNFGPMQTLQVDEHRAWSSDVMREWCTEHGIQLQISPGQSHTRLAILERRHQVTRRALTLFLNANPGIAAEPDGLITALNYVIPQINRMPNVCGYSPVQWTLGYTPHIPGLLMDEMTAHNPAYLDPSSRLMEKLRLQQEAAKATAEADTDRRLRRALLRKYMGQHVMLNTGDLCFYWRDAPTGSSAKLQWRGPATIIMREPGPGGPTSDIYWIGHGTSLLRAAPEHVKPAHPPADDAAQALDPLQSARQALDNVRNRGVTNYTDLGRTNKRRREEIDTDEEDTHDDRDYAHLPHADLPPDTWQTSEDGRVWTRVHNIPRRRLFVPTFAEDVPVHLFSLTRVTDVRRGGPHPDHVRITDDWKLPHADRELHYVWTGTTTFVVENERSPPWSDEPPPSSLMRMMKPTMNMAQRLTPRRRLPRGLKGLRAGPRRRQRHREPHPVPHHQTPQPQAVAPDRRWSQSLWQNHPLHRGR